ncbi:hypothetical protein IB286_04395 [Spongiibacter sp. KMU-158]|uniref:Transcriptional regulator SutA RNAP-binding domain-containing protein n=1 Tax=Spongiibacter pelagi TaxID=2760804 RepID=A0A927BZ39_9GAMM|nr:hypothetical protein [Spongiibacter pelagi]MBD2858239.1 hypothetical protein [Spongiibacter pelagi]
MNRRNQPQPLYSNPHQQSIRAEISRQIEEFMAKGGKIEQLTGPAFQASRSVGVSKSILTELL